MKLSSLNNNHRMFILLLLGWGVILTTALFWSSGTEGESYNLFSFVMFSINITVMAMIYIINYIYVIPQQLFKSNIWRFIAINLTMFALLITVSEIIKDSELITAIRPSDLPRRPRPKISYIIKDIISYALVVGLVTAFRLAERLRRSEEALREAESARIKAELDNLRSQINPHFLLNTLNNIYALTAIDADKAQKTIKELSDLLRYLLYENRNERVSLKGEVEFLKSYIELMSIRLPRKMELKTEFKLSKGCSTQIAPLIFISLIENAFKHSVGADGSGFIEIYFEDLPERGEVVLSIKNSDNAKSDGDKSGHGIGLDQVQRRLDMLYAESYLWEVERSDGEYRSLLILKNV